METPTIPQSAVELAEQIDSKNAKRLAEFIAEMDSKDTSELKNILKAVGQTVQRKAPMIARCNWQLGNVMGEAAVLAAGIDVDNHPAIRTKTKPTLKNGEIVPTTVYYNSVGLKHIKANFLKQRIESASAEISDAIYEFTNFMSEFAELETAFQEASKTVPKPENFGTLAAEYAAAEAKYITLRKNAGFSGEQVSSAEALAEKEHQAKVLEVQSLLEYVKSHVSMNRAKMQALNHMIKSRESSRLSKEVADADKRKLAVPTA